MLPGHPAVLLFHSWSAEHAGGWGWGAVWQAGRQAARGYCGSWGSYPEYLGSWGGYHLCCAVYGGSWVAEGPTSVLRCAAGAALCDVQCCGCRTMCSAVQPSN